MASSKPTSRSRPAATRAPTRGKRTAAKRPPPKGRGRAATARNGKRRSWLWRYRRLLFAVGLLAFTALAGVAYLLTRVPLPDEDPDVGKQTTFITDINGNRLASLDSGVNRVNARLEDIPDVVVDAVLSTEDKSFFEHNGLDPFGIARATVNDIRNRGDRVQGGSTITQQYVKNVYVGNERTIWRKLKEAALAMKVEQKLDKDEILERYLNTIYLGRGAYGVQAASRAYFGVDATELGLKEAAYLAGLIRAPQLADAYQSPEEAAGRRSRTLANMVRNGKISDADRDEVVAIPLQQYVLAREKIEPEVVLADKGTTYFVEHVRAQLVERFGEAAVYGGGLRVRTTLDVELQQHAYDAVYGFLNRPEDPAGALVSVDADGNVRAMVGGRDWKASKVNLAAGKEGGGTGRQAGSTFKPFLLAAIVKDGYTVESAFPAPAEVILPKANNGKDYKVRNYEDADYGGEPMNLIDATKSSVNTVYAQAQLALGSEKLVTMAHEMGIRSDLQPNASLVLGTSEVSVLEMAGAFSTLSRRGVQVDPRVIVEVTNAEGAKLPWDRASPHRALDESDADVVNAVLRQVVTAGSGTGAAVRGTQVAGKTGTTQDFGDAWFVGYTPKLTTAVWMGYPEGNSRKMLNVRGRKVNGGSFPATIFRRFMEPAMKAGDYSGSFAEVTRFPGKVLKGSDRVRFSTSTTSTSSSAPPTTVAPKPTTTAPPPTTSPPTTAKPPPSTTSTTAAPSGGAGGGKPDS